jgi:hypothetical protein
VQGRRGCIRRRCRNNGIKSIGVQQVQDVMPCVRAIDCKSGGSGGPPYFCSRREGTAASGFDVGASADVCVAGQQCPLAKLADIREC